MAATAAATEEFVTIPRREYEALQTRVHILQETIAVLQKNSSAQVGKNARDRVAMRCCSATRRRAVRNFVEAHEVAKDTRAAVRAR